MVLVAHLTGGYYIHIDQIYSQKVQNIISDIGAFGVEVFFILSGYVIYIACQKASARKFFTHRFWRIYPLFFAVTIVFFLVNFMFGLDPDKNQLLYLVWNLLFLELFLDTPALSPNAWSLTYEVWYYFITFAIVQGVRNRKLDVLSVIGLAVLFYFIVNFPITLYFILGVFLAHIYLHRYVRIENRVLASSLQLAALLMVIFLAGSGVEFGGEGWGTVWKSPGQLLLPLSLFILMYCLLDDRTLLSGLLCKKPMFFLGNVSYSLYLIHPYTYLLSRNVIEMLSLSSMYLTFFFFVFISVFLSIAAAYVVNRYFENFIYSYFVHKNIYK